jgi:hypothetical protein
VLEGGDDALERPQHQGRQSPAAEGRAGTGRKRQDRAQPFVRDGREAHERNVKGSEAHDTRDGSRHCDGMPPYQRLPRHHCVGGRSPGAEPSPDPSEDPEHSSFKQRNEHGERHDQRGPEQQSDATRSAAGQRERCVSQRNEKTRHDGDTNSALWRHGLR